MIEDKKQIYEDKDYINVVNDLINNPEVQKMKLYRQHYDVNCFDHCLYVSYNLYLMCKKRKLDYVSAARAAMVHDLFLYNWRERQEDRKGLHAFTHPKTAYENASKIMNINKKEKNIILSHMWPVTFFHFPTCRESWLITYIDKRFAVIERRISLKQRKNNDKKIYNS